MEESPLPPGAGPLSGGAPPDRPWPPGWAWPPLPGGAGPPPGRAGVRIAHGRAAAPRADSGFSAGFRGSRKSSTSRRRSPMCRRDLSAHGKISTTLNAEAFPHDSADPLAVGPGRMCSIAPTGPAPRTRSRQHLPRHRGRAHATTSRTTPWRWLRMGKSNWSEPKSQCTYRCVVLPDVITATKIINSEHRLNAPTGAWCSLTARWPGGVGRRCSSQCTYRCVVLPDLSTEQDSGGPFGGLNAPTGAWCSLT